MDERFSMKKIGCVAPGAASVAGCSNTGRRWQKGDLSAYGSASSAPGETPKDRCIKILLVAVAVSDRHVKKQKYKSIGTQRWN